MPVVLSDDADNDALIVAPFSDGSTAVVPGMTVGEYKLHLPSLQNRAHAPSLYSKIAPQTQHEISIRQRVDRKLLVSIYEHTKQVLQVRADRFGEVGDDDNKTLDNAHPTIQKALAFLSPLADKFVDGELSKDGLTLGRDRLLKQMSCLARDANKKTQTFARRSSSFSYTTDRRQCHSGGCCDGRSFRG